MRGLVTRHACSTAHDVVDFLNQQRCSREEHMKRGRPAVAAGFMFGPIAARADMKALEEAAKKEGELTWYVAHYTSEGAEELGAAFTKMYGIKVNVVRTTAQVAYQRVHAGHQEQPGHLRRLLLDRPRPLRASQGRGPPGKVRAGGRVEDLRGVSQHRSGRLFQHHFGRTGGDLLQYIQGQARGCAQEMDRPSRPEVEGQGIDRPPGLLGLCRHLGPDDEEALRLGVFRASWRRTSRRSGARSTTR